MIKEDFKFSGRNKRPPRDAFNSMISLGYTILMYEIMGEIENRGITPYIGLCIKILKDIQHLPVIFGRMESGDCRCNSHEYDSGK